MALCRLQKVFFNTVCMKSKRKEKKYKYKTLKQGIIVRICKPFISDMHDKFVDYEGPLYKEVCSL